MIRFTIRILGALVALGSMIWFFNDKDFEPLLTSIAGVITFLGTFADRSIPLFHRREVYTAEERNQDNCEGPSESNDLFYSRFLEVFPGVRGIQWVKNPDKCIELLVELLAPPLEFEDYTPFWWWRGNSNMPIKNFRHIGGRKILMDKSEMVIRRIAAVSHSHPARVFVYVECSPDKPSGATKITKAYRVRDLQTFGYCSEEFGLLQNRVITRSEYDDGVAVIDGTRIKIDGKADLRLRFLSPYNFVIASHSSPINNDKFDSQFEELMNAILKGESTVEDLASKILALPRNTIEYHQPNR